MSILSRNKEAISNILVANDRAESDAEMGRLLALMKKARVRVHVRGTDKNPVVEVKDRLTGATLGGIALKGRLQE